MAENRIEETEEVFNARMAAISSEAKHANKSQTKPIESSQEVFGALFSPSSKEDQQHRETPHQANTGDPLYGSSVPDDAILTSSGARLAAI